MNPDRHLDQLAARLTRAAHIYPTIQQHLHQQTGDINNLRASTTNTGTSNPGSHSDPTANTATRLATITRTQHHLTATITQIETAINNLYRQIDIISRQLPATPQATLCRDGGHGKTLSPKLGGAVANCHALPHKAGLCVRHYQAWWRERDTTTAGHPKRGGTPK